MSNIFAELQQMSITDSAIEETRQTLNRLCEYMQNLEWQDEMISLFAELRHLSPVTIKNAGGFMVLDDMAVNQIPEEFRHDSLGFVEGYRLVYSGRFVFPVKDVKGNVAGFVGYDKFEEPKYLDSKNHGYKAKQTILYGMENLREYYESDYVIITEGSICKLWLQEQGFNSLSTLGSYLSPYVVEVLKRFGRRCIVFPDTDDAGNKFKSQIKRDLPQAQIWQCKFAKDIDDARQLNPELKDEIEKILKNPFHQLKLIG